MPVRIWVVGLVGLGLVVLAGAPAKAQTVVLNEPFPYPCTLPSPPGTCQSIPVQTSNLWSPTTGGGCLVDFYPTAGGGGGIISDTYCSTLSTRNTSAPAAKGKMTFGFTGADPNCGNCGWSAPYVGMDLSTSGSKGPGMLFGISNAPPSGFVNLICVDVKGTQLGNVNVTAAAGHSIEFDWDNTVPAAVTTTCKADGTTFGSGTQNYSAFGVFAPTAVTVLGTGVGASVPAGQGEAVISNLIVTSLSGGKKQGGASSGQIIGRRSPIVRSWLVSR